MPDYDVIVIGAGAAGMMCAIEAGKRGRKVLVLEHNKKPGEKIRISGGGRCNFTNAGTSAGNFLSANSKFAISALKRFSQREFVALVDRYGIAHHEKVLGQLFCDGSAQQIIDMLLKEMREAGVDVRTSAEVASVMQTADGFALTISPQVITCSSLAVASGGKSIPKMGASNFGYRLATQFDVRVTETRPALVPLTFDPDFLARTAPLAGVSVDATVSCGKAKFAEALLFTHRGLSGPAILQISSFWREGDEIVVDLAPGVDVLARLKQVRSGEGRREAVSVLSEHLPHALAQMIAESAPGRLADMNDKALGKLAAHVNAWRIKPTGSEGYRTAEVTLGGVDTAALDAKTLAARDVPGLYFIGEVVDVTGWLGGYNFQWAWSSGWAAGQVV